MYPLSFMRSVYVLCFKYHGSVASWGRTEKHNKEVGGVPNSYHLLWVGCDIVLDDMRQNTDFENDATFFGLKAILENDHYHVQPKDAK